MHGGQKKLHITCNPPVLRWQASSLQAFYVHQRRPHRLLLQSSRQRGKAAAAAHHSSLWSQKQAQQGWRQQGSRRSGLLLRLRRGLRYQAQDGCPQLASSAWGPALLTWRQLSISAGSICLGCSVRHLLLLLLLPVFQWPEHFCELAAAGAELLLQQAILSRLYCRRCHCRGGCCHV
jgi:hypothetical protein